MMFFATHEVDDSPDLPIGRIRLSDTDALAGALARRGIPVPKDRSELPAVALNQLGLDALQYFRGEFSFVARLPSGEILAARDQLGIHPLFYSLAGGVLRISDDLGRIVAGISGLTINNNWVAGYASRFFSTRHGDTVYNEISRLPPAHYLLWSNGRLAIRRYWTLPFDDPPRYGREEEICEAFRAALEHSLRDHLPEGPCGLTMSGGLDSPTLAAEIIRLQGSDRNLITRTHVFDYLIEDDERKFVDLIGKHLGFTPLYVAVDENQYDPAWKSHLISSAEPTLRSTNARLIRPIAAAMAKEAPIWFEGEGPDNALAFEWHAYLRWLARTGQWQTCLRDTMLYMARKPAVEWVNHVKGLADRLLRRQQQADETLLTWAQPGFRSTLRQALEGTEAEERRHPWHPAAFSDFQSSRWQAFLEVHDPQISGTPIEWRHPFLDLRVLSFMLSLPPIPWGRRKYLLRKAMAGRLPSEVLRRPKTPLRSSPLTIMLQRHPLTPLTGGAIQEYFDISKVPAAPSQPSDSDRLLGIHILDSWLRKIEPS